MGKLKSKGSRRPGKARAALLPLIALLAACTSEPQPDELRILLGQKPNTLNPRMALDANAQRIGALLFRGLTRIDEDLRPQPDLASGWSLEEGGRLWRFRLREDLKDHEGTPITARAMAACLEQYRSGKPFSPHAAAFPNWTGTEATDDFVLIRLSRPDPYLARNLSLLRFFRNPGTGEPCSEPDPSRFPAGSGTFRMEEPELAPQGDFTLVSDQGKRVRFLFVRDDTTLALRLLRGDVHLSQNSLSLPKSGWMKKAHSDRFVIKERDGVTVSYLVFNLRDGILANRDVRRAIAHAIDRDSIVRHKLFGFCQKAESLLSPTLPEYHASPLPFDRALSEKLLDGAGYRRGPDGMRLQLRYKTQPFRDSIEMALVFREQLRAVGIDLQVEVVEPAAWLASVMNGRFQLSQGRWVGISDGSILYRTLHSGQRNNRAGYRNPDADRALELAMAEPDDAKRARLLAHAQRIMAEDLPYFPLWYWNNALFARKEMAEQLRDLKISLSGGLEPLVYLEPR